MIYSVIVVLISNYIGNRFESPFKSLQENIKILTSSDKDKTQLTTHFFTEEFSFLQTVINNALHVYEERNREKKAIADLALQVAHDIRSPVSAILMLSEECVDLPENQRTTLRNAAIRIQDIANYLLNQYDNKKNQYNSMTSFLVASAISSVLSEKRIEYKNFGITFSYEVSTDAAFAFVQINLADFKRMISNIVNNAADAMSLQGAITVKLLKEKDNLVIKIIDTGKGMPPEFIKNLLNGEHVSSRKKGGHGFGLAHAQMVLKKFNAQLDIASEINVGTQVSLIFRTITTPIWIADEIEFYLDDRIIILDDDASIHGAWDTVLAPIIKNNPALQVLHFTQGRECMNYIENFPDKNKILLLVDYELIKQNINGLDVIEAVKAKRAVLVTSHDEDLEVIKRSILLNTKLLPKVLAPFIKLHLASA